MIEPAFSKPNLARNFREIRNLDVINCEAWAKTFEASGLTADEVRLAVDAEFARRLREPTEELDG